MLTSASRPESTNIYKSRTTDFEKRGVIDSGEKIEDRNCSVLLAEVEVTKERGGYEGSWGEY